MPTFCSTVVRITPYCIIHAAFIFSNAQIGLMCFKNLSILRMGMAHWIAGSGSNFGFDADLSTLRGMETRHQLGSKDDRKPIGQGYACTVLYMPYRPK